MLDLMINKGASNMLQILIVVVLAFMFSAGCKTGSDIPAQTTANSELAMAPTPEPAPEPTMPILREIANYKRSKQSASTREIADYANGLLPKYGFQYDLDLERIITAKTKQHQTKPTKIPGDDDEYVKFDLDVVSVDGAKKKLPVVAPANGSCCCGYYYTPIPVTKITPKELTVVIDAQEIVITRPKEIPVVQEYILGKEQAKLTKLRSWEVPYETYPYGVSTDGKKLYVKTDIDELLLEIAESGELRFVPTETEGIVANGEDLNKLPPPKVGEILRKSGEFGLMRYMLNGIPYVVEFPYPCT